MDEKKLIRVAGGILDKAKEVVTQDRAEEHGSAVENYELTARYWSVRLGKTISPAEVMDCMALLKLARSQQNPDKLDNWVDRVGYVSLAAGLSRKKADKSVVDFPDKPARCGGCGVELKFKTNPFHDPVSLHCGAEECAEKVSHF